jgi:hypothetical protein
LLPKFDFPHAYLHCDLSSSFVNDYVRQMMTEKEGIYIKEYAVDNMKAIEIIKTGFNIRFTSDGENSIHIWF